jgi:threonylcarbamoyladenosine tRNA methylthiotransferase MtaB
MNVHLKTLGCRLNEAELEMWAHDFQKAGHHITQELTDAQLVIINSCAVTNDAAKKSRHLIRKLHRENPLAKLVVSGCYATLNTDEVKAILGVDMVIGNQEKPHLVQKILNELSLTSMPLMAAEPDETSLFTRGRQRAFVKVQDGCRYRCTFCIVTIARGEESSRPIQDIVDEVNQLHQQGITEVVLTGVHLGGYGSDLNTQLTKLISTLLTDTTIPRIRLGSLEPWEFTEDFFALFAHPRLMPHLHLPLQSGSDSVLRRMARRCKTDEFANIVKRIRSTHPYFNITTDIIVGFPGETEQEWQESIEFIQKIGFGHIHIFSYSAREGTKAESLPNHVSHDLKKQRSEALHRLAQHMKQQFYRANIGQCYPILWEAQTAMHATQKLAFGYTPNYLRVQCAIDPTENLANQILTAELIAVTEDKLEAKIQA